MEWVKAGGKVTDCMIALEIEVDEVVYQVVRFDNSHGSIYHQHLPGFPEPSKEKVFLPGVPPNEWLAHARDEMLRNYRQWETIVLGNVVLRIEDEQ